MKTILRFEFDFQFFYPEYNGPRNIIMENPLHIPQTGDPVNFKIKDYFDDKKVIRKFEDLEDGNVFYAQRLQTTYGKETIEVIVVIYEEKIFKEIFPQYIRDSLF
jgi:predicted RNA-binding protein